MHGFRDRPLTWLFIAATICVDLVMILPVMFPSRVPFLSQGIDAYVPLWILSVGVPAQLILVAVWAATSESYRLARAAVLTAAVYAALFSAMLFGRTQQEVVLYFFVPALVVWGGALVLRMLGLLPGWCPGGTADSAIGTNPQPLKMHRLGEDRTPWKARPWQFSLVELFGWTCIVALWSFAMHHADLAHDWWYWLAGMVVGPLVTLVLVGGPGPWWIRCCLGLLGIAAFLVPLRWDDFLMSGVFLTSAYLALWYAVRHLDGALGTLHVEARNPKHEIRSTKSGKKFE